MVTFMLKVKRIADLENHDTPKKHNVFTECVLYPHPMKVWTWLGLGPSWGQVLWDTKATDNQKPNT